MNQIFVSTDVFSLIWSARQPGEESESDILVRVLSKKSGTAAGIVKQKESKVIDLDAAIPSRLRDAYW